MSKHVEPSAALSPKFKYAALVGLGLVALQAVLSALTPEMFEWAGDFQPVLYSLVTAVGAAVAAYAKGDPLREVGSAAVVAGEIPPSLPHPDAVPEFTEADPTVTEADALALRAAEIRQGGVK